MNQCRASTIALLLVTACSRPSAPSPADSAATVQRLDDSIIALRIGQAPALADTARTTLSALLKQPATAVFDSLIVVQPPKDGDSWPSPVVCGRIAGKPGIGGRTTPTPFVYQNRINVFLLDQNNAAAFGALRSKECANAGARVLFTAK